MPKEMTKHTNVDEYIASAPENVRTKLNQLRELFLLSAEDDSEKISYGMPSYLIDGHRAYYGYFKDHVSVFPLANGVEKFKKLSSDYKTSKGTIIFPLDKPLPVDLIKKLFS